MYLEPKTEEFWFENVEFIVMIIIKFPNESIFSI